MSGIYVTSGSPVEKINKRFPRTLFSPLWDIVLSTPAILHFYSYTYYYYSYYNKLFNWITWSPSCLPGHNQRAFGGLINIFIQVTNNLSETAAKMTVDNKDTKDDHS